jgi:hypothetical protein
MADLTISQLLALAPKLMPMTDRIQAAAAVAQEIEADPHVKDALLTAEKYLADPKVKDALQTVQDVTAILNQAQG